MKSIFDNVKPSFKSAMKIYEACSMVDEVISRNRVTRTIIDTAFLQWYSEMLKLAVGIENTVPRKVLVRVHRITMKRQWLLHFWATFKVRGSVRRVVISCMVFYASCHPLSLLQYQYMLDMLKWQCRSIHGDYFNHRCLMTTSNFCACLILCN